MSAQMVERAAPRTLPGDARRAQARFPRSTASAGLARRFTAETCAAWSIEDLATDAALVVSELVENAVRHARSACDLTLELTGAGFVVTARDDSTDEPRLLWPGPTRPGGRGLVLVEKLCSDWGFDIVADGKRVWAVLPPAPRA